MQDHPGIPDTTYNVFGGTLNFAQPTTNLPKAITDFSLITGNSYKMLKLLACLYLIIQTVY